jgi:hypothetical protein
MRWVVVGCVLVRGLVVVLHVRYIRAQEEKGLGCWGMVVLVLDWEGFCRACCGLVGFYLCLLVFFFGGGGGFSVCWFYLC